jgi:capsular polysaccharide biosynthesis protein
MSYVSRSRAEDRRVRGEGMLLKAIEAGKPGWLVLLRFGDDPSPDMRDTIRLFANTHVTIGMHGAGLSNAVFMPAGGHLIEFSLEQSGTHCFAHLAMAMSFRYWQVRRLPVPIPAHGDGVTICFPDVAVRQPICW